MADWLPPEHLVWFVLDVVEALDTSAWHAGRRLGGAGRQGFDPDMLLALLVYAYAVGERSSRQIERLCSSDVAFRVVCAQDGPDHSTIARFRAQHEAAFAGLFAQVLAMCARAGMGRVGTVAVDGTKIGADASLGANRSGAWLQEQAERIVKPPRWTPLRMPCSGMPAGMSCPRRGVGVTASRASPPRWRSWTARTNRTSRPARPTRRRRVSTSGGCRPVRQSRVVPLGGSIR
jgi:transposase